MKKYLSVLLSLIIFLMSVCVNADEEASISVKVFPEAIENEIIQSDIEETEILETEDEDDSPIELYSANDDSWSEEANMPSGRADFDTVIINDELYVVGGFGNSGHIYTIDKFNVDTSLWETVTSIPDEVNGFSVVGVGDDIYIIGGYNDNTYLNDVQIYNTVGGTWTTGTAMFERRDKAAALYADGKIYVFGGRNAKGFVNSYEYYDIANNEWCKVTSGYDESLIRLGARAKYINGYVCIYGGYNQQYENIGVSLYSASDMNDVTQMTSKGSEHISIAWGQDKALIFSSTSSNTSVYSVSEMIVNENTVDINITNIINYPINARYVQNVIYKGHLYCMGGYTPSSKTYNTNMYKYSVNYGGFVTGDGEISGTVTEAGNTITLNVEAEKSYCFMVNVKNMNTFEGYTFSIEYPDGSFSVLDACAMTEGDDRSEGSVIGSDIQISEITSDGISFTCSESVPSGKKVSETVNTVILKSNSSGQRKITYGMKKN